MIVYFPSPFRSYTGGQSKINIKAGDYSSVNELINELDRRYPGMRFGIINEQNKIRSHIKLFINYSPAESLNSPIDFSDEIHIITVLTDE